MENYWNEMKTELLSRKELLRLRGPLEIPMTNDYLFRALLQQNNRVLKALICALLHLDPKRVQVVKVENPIELGKSYAEKELILDVKATLDGNIVINLEMQVVNEYNWIERSMYYLCSSFEHLNKGVDYLKVRPAVQIGFLNFSLFPEAPEFYANYYLLNEKTHQKYSDKLRLAVVDLTQILLATEEDKKYKIDQWARFFKARDWSELAMLARENEDILSAMGTIYQLSREQKIRQQCEARMDYYKREGDRRYRDELADERDKKADERDAKADERDKKADERDAKANERDAKADERDAKADERDAKADERDRMLDAKEEQLAEQERKLKEKELEIKKMLQEVKI